MILDQITVQFHLSLFVLPDQNVGYAMRIEGFESL